MMYFAEGNILFVQIHYDLINMLIRIILFNVSGIFLDEQFSTEKKDVLTLWLSFLIGQQVLGCLLGPGNGTIIEIWEG